MAEQQDGKSKDRRCDGQSQGVKRMRSTGTSAITTTVRHLRT